MSIICKTKPIRSFSLASNLISPHQRRSSCQQFGYTLLKLLPFQSRQKTKPPIVDIVTKRFIEFTKHVLGLSSSIYDLYFPKSCSTTPSFYLFQTTPCQDRTLTNGNICQTRLERHNKPSSRRKWIITAPATDGRRGCR